MTDPILFPAATSPATDICAASTVAKSLALTKTKEHILAALTVTQCGESGERRKEHERQKIYSHKHQAFSKGIAKLSM